MVQCEELELTLEAIADGTRHATAAERDHLAGCDRCRARLELARSIESVLVTREIAIPPPAFTADVMARVGTELWQVERMVDIGFNLALAIGTLVVVASGAGLAWSLGFFTITIDPDAIDLAVRSLFTPRLGTQVQTAAIAAMLLVMTLGLWWWVESDSAM